MYLILMMYACLISCYLINKYNCHSLAYFNLHWTCVVILHKCKCLHTGHRNLDVNYKMGDTVLGTTVKEKDLVVTTSADISEQCGIAASKGNKTLGLIRRNIVYKEKS